MVDYTGKEWYDETLSATELFAAFESWQEDFFINDGDFADLDEVIKKEMNDTYTDLKLKAKCESKVIKNFEKEKKIAFDNLRAAHDSEIQALGVLWQSYEDNNYTIPQ